MKTRAISLTALLLAVFLFAGAALSYASTSPQADPAVLQSIPQGNGMLQFVSNGHVMGFGKDTMHIVGADHMLRVRFLGTGGVAPHSSGQADTASAGTPALKQVMYTNIWDGITLSYDAVKGGIAESTYRIESGADVSRIRLQYNAPVELLPNGALKISFGAGYMMESAPIAWQVINGEKRPVQVAFSVQDGTIGFRVGTYDRSLPLIIDPAYTWHTFYGNGSGLNSGHSIAVDGAGNVYVAGESSATWNGPGGGDNPLHAFSGATNLFVLKLGSDGDYQWHTFYGAGNTYGHALALDAANNVYVTGSSSVSWNAPAAPLHAFAAATANIFVLKLNTNGAYQWHTFYGEDRFNSGFGIGVDGGANVYVVGESTAPWTGPSGQAPLNDYTDLAANAVVFKLDTNGGYQWHTFYGSNGNASANGVAVSAAGDVYAVGSTDTTWSGPADDAPLNAFSDGESDIFVLALNTAGAYQWHTFHGGASFGNGIALDSATGALYIAATSTASWNGPAAASPLKAFAGAAGIANLTVLKLNAGGAYAWHTFYGVAAYDTVANNISFNNVSVYVAGTGNAPLAGPAGQAPVNPYTGIAGTANAVTLKLNAAGAYQWHSMNGATSFGNGVAITGDSSVYIAGESQITWDSPLGDNPLHAFAGTVSDLFVLKFTDPAVCPVITVNNPANASGAAGIAFSENFTQTGGANPATFLVVSGVLPNGMALSSAGTLSGTPLQCGSFPITVSATDANACNATGVQYNLTIACPLVAFTANSNGNGSGTLSSGTAGVTCAGASCNGNIPWDTAVTVAATAATGSTFTGWTGCDFVNGNQCTVDMIGPKTITATFTLNQYTLTANATGTGTGTVSSNVGGINYTYPPTTTGSTTQNFGTAITLTAASATSIVSWSGPCDAQGGTVFNATCTVNLSGNTTVLATFTSCAFGLTPTTASVVPAGGAGSVAVTANNALCSWTAVSNAPWITITGGAAGNGNGTVQYTVDANATALPRTGTITIAGLTYTVTQGTTTLQDRVGVYGNAFWYLDMNGGGTWEGEPTDRIDNFGFTGAVPVKGDWDNTGTSKIAVYADGFWYVDLNGNGAWDGETTDRIWHFGFTGAVPATGDWDGTGTSKIAVYADGFWYVDLNGNGAWDGEPTDRIYHFGFAGAVPVTGDWDNTGTTRIGVYADGFWYLDINGNGAWDGEPTDRVVHFGFAGALPAPGDWTGDGSTKVGVYFQNTWYIDLNGSGVWEGVGIDTTYFYGFPGAMPMPGLW